MKPKVYVTRKVPEEGIVMLQRDCEVEVWEGELPSLLSFPPLRIEPPHFRVYHQKTRA